MKRQYKIGQVLFKDPVALLPMTVKLIQYLALYTDCHIQKNRMQFYMVWRRQQISAAVA
jgi:hypothetical protein